MENKTWYEIIEHHLATDADRNICTGDRYEINSGHHSVSLKSIEDCHTVAKLADIECYTIIKKEQYVEGVNGYNTKRTEVYTSLRLKAWQETRHQYQKERASRKSKIEEQVRALPTETVLYDDGTIVVKAVLNAFTGSQKNELQRNAHYAYSIKYLYRTKDSMTRIGSDYGSDNYISNARMWSSTMERYNKCEARKFAEGINYEKYSDMPHWKRPQITEAEVKEARKILKKVLEGKVALLQAYERLIAKY